MLPEGSTRIEYIESTGSQYIDTGFTPNQDTRVVMEAQMLTSSSGKFYFGSRTTNATVNYNVLLGGSAPYIRSDYGESKLTTSAVGVTDRVLIDKNKNICTINGTSITNAASTFTCGQPLFLFASNNGGTASYLGDLKLYSCQIYDNGTLVRDYIPYIDENGDANLWDDVTNTAATKAGTFTAGPVVEPPSAPESIRTQTAVTLAWDAVADAASYNIYRDGTLIGSTTATQYADMTVAENETYTYGVSAVGDGGESAQTEITVYTRTGYFQYKPYIETANFL